MVRDEEGKCRYFWRTLVLVAAAHAQSVQPWEIGPFTRPANGNPVITPRPESTFTDPILKAPAHWEALHTFNPAAIVREGKVYVLYRAEDNSGTMQIGMHTSRLGLAESDDGIHFTRRPEPVFFPGPDSQKAREWPGGVEDPRIVEGEDGTYVLTYTQWNRKTYSVGIATSPDLTHWTKHGPAFLTAAGGKYAHLKYKSAGIVTRLDKDKKRLIAAKIDGKYWMYWGEGAIHLATSHDLIHWTPVEDAGGNADRTAAPARRPLRQHLPRDRASAGPDRQGHRGALQRQECGERRRSHHGTAAPMRLARHSSMPKIQNTCSSRPTRRC